MKEGGTVRDRMISYIQENPGVHFNDIRRELDIAYGQTQYHLHKLEKDELVRSVKDQNRKRFYPADGESVPRSSLQKKLLLLLRQEKCRTILYYMLENEPCTNRELALWLKMPKSTVNFYIRRLIEKDIVKKEDNCFHLVDRDIVEEELGNIRDTVSERVANSLLDGWMEL